MQLLYKRFVLYTLKKPRACHGYRVDIYRDGWFSSRATDYYWPSFCETNHSNSPISLKILFFQDIFFVDNKICILYLRYKLLICDVIRSDSDIFALNFCFCFCKFACKIFCILYSVYRL